MRPGAAAMVLAVMVLSGLARAQSESDATPMILLHPRVPTILQLPDAVEQVRVYDRDELRVTFFGDRVYVRPRPGTPAGTEASLEVETRTGQWSFRLRVVARAREANLDILVMPAGAQNQEDRTPEGAPVPRVEEASTVSASANQPDPATPPAAPAPAPAPAAPAPAAPAPAPTRAEPIIARDTEPAAERAAAPPYARRFEVSVHAFAAPAGTSEVTVPGYTPLEARRPLRAFGGRIAVGPRDACWAVEANISGEWPAAPTVHAKKVTSQRISVSGPSLLVDMGMRARLRTQSTPTAYLGFGLRAHHRDIEVINGDTEPDLPPRALPFGGVLTLGLGFEHRTGDLLLGLEVVVRQGVPDDYHSVAAFLSAGMFLDQGE